MKVLEKRNKSELFESGKAGEVYRDGRDLRGLVGWRGVGPTLAAAVVSGLLLSAVFPPLEWAWAAWFALLPILAAPIPRRFTRRLLVGYVFGLSHFATSLYWLNEVVFFAGYLLSIYCAFFLLAWYLLFADVVTFFLSREGKSTANLSVSGRIYISGLSALSFMLAGLLIALGWVGLEWVRSWLFTGFPWNHFGLSQWQNPGLLQTTTVTGIYGLSFLLIMANLALLWIAVSHWHRWAGRGGGTMQFPWPVAAALLVLAPSLYLMYRGREKLEAPDARLEIAAVQGNLPQARVWTEGQLEKAIRVYEGMSREAARVDPDLIVWPETAVPAPAFYNPDYQQMLERLTTDIQTPLLFGNMHMEPVHSLEPEKGMEVETYNDFNSVFLLDREGRVMEYYYKVRLVPFGEYVPMGDILPFLHDLIGMGRDLSAGREYTLFELREGIWAGVNICFEDVFPQVSSNFVLRGANLLMTLTNDAWFAESPGSRQHMTHAVVRAVENRRPLMRSGNSSDTALIMPNGEVRGLLYDHETGDRFIRDWRKYTVPVWFDLGTTFYTRHGNVFAAACFLVVLLWLLWRIVWSVQRNVQLRRIITGEEN